MSTIFRFFYVCMLPLISESISANPNKPNLCVNCRYFTNNFFIPNRFGKCRQFPIESRINNNADFLVTGRKKKEIADYHFCSVAREMHHLCGKEGRLYEQK